MKGYMRVSKHCIADARTLGALTTAIEIMQEVSVEIRSANRHLASAAHLGLQAHARPPSHVEGADALGAVDLVSRDGHQVDVVCVDIHRDLAHCLGSVCVEEHLPLPAQLADLSHGLHHTCNTPMPISALK